MNLSFTLPPITLDDPLPSLSTDPEKADNEANSRIKSAIVPSIMSVSTFFILLSNEVSMQQAVVIALCTGALAFATALILTRNNSNPSKQPNIQYTREQIEVIQRRLREAPAKVKEIIAEIEPKIDKLLKEKDEKIEEIQQDINEQEQKIAKLSKLQQDLTSINVTLDSQRIILESTKDNLGIFKNSYDIQIQAQQVALKARLNYILKGLPEGDVNHIMTDYRSIPKFGLVHFLY